MTAISSRLNTALLVLVLLSVLTLIGIVATRSLAGPLDPSAPPVSTGIPIDEAGSWSRTLSDVGGCTSFRFKCVMPTGAQPTGEAVLDRETGLVWQRGAGIINVDWGTAETLCHGATTGGRLGWRVPSATELRTISDTDGDGVWPGMPLFAGGVDDREYWTATHHSTFSSTAAVIDFDQTTNVIYTNTSNLNGHWCVRGPGSERF